MNLLFAYFDNDLHRCLKVTLFLGKVTVTVTFLKTVTSYSKSYNFGNQKSYSYKLLFVKVPHANFVFLGSEPKLGKINFARKNFEIFS